MVARSSRGPGLSRAAMVCALLGGALYVNTLSCGFAFDDKAVILDNPDIRPNSSWSNVILNDYWGTPMSDKDSHKSYRPLTVATFRLNYMLHELQPLGYHLVNVVLHSAVCYLYVLLCGVVFSEVWPALIAGLLFAVHPIHTEAVAGVVGRAELTSCLFFLLSLLFYFKATSHDSLNRNVIWTLLCVICSLISKEQGVMVVGVVFVYDVFIANQVSPSTVKSVLQTKHPHSSSSSSSSSNQVRLQAMAKRLFVVAVFFLTVMAIRLRMMGNTPTFNVLDNEGLQLDPPYRGLYWAYLIFINTWLLINPSHLLHDYRMGAIPSLSTMSDPRHFLTLLTFSIYFCLGLFAVGCFGVRRRRTRRRRSDGVDLEEERRTERGGWVRRGGMIEGYTSHQRALLFGLALLILPFLPASNLFLTVGFVVAERVLFLPSMGSCFVIGFGAYTLIASRRRLLRLTSILGLALILISHSVKVIQRNPDWESKLTLYEAGVKLYPHNGDLLGNIGLNYRRRGDSELAEVVYRYAMEVAPNISLPYLNFGVMLKEENRLEEAEEVLKQAAEKMLRDSHAKLEKAAKVHITVANMVAVNDSRLDEALRYVTRGVEIYPTLSNSHNSRGSILHKMGRILDAQAEFEEAVKLNPKYANARFNLGLVLYQQGMVERSVEQFRKTLAVDPQHNAARLQLEAMAQRGEVSEKHLTGNGIGTQSQSGVRTEQKRK